MSPTAILQSKGRSQRLITDYLPTVKKSQRIANQKKPNEDEELKRKCIANGIDPPGFKIQVFPVKGRGVVANKLIPKGSFVCEYAGDLIDRKEAEKREKKYLKENKGSYMYYFSYQNVKYCVDATAEPNADSPQKLGRLINHSRKNFNCKMTVFEQKSIPHLTLIATEDIHPKEELLYDYGERSRAAMKAFPWLSD